MCIFGYNCYVNRINCIPIYTQFLTTAESRYLRKFLMENSNSVTYNFLLTGSLWKYWPQLCKTIIMNVKHFFYYRVFGVSKLNCYDCGQKYCHTWEVYCWYKYVFHMVWTVCLSWTAQSAKSNLRCYSLEINEANFVFSLLLRFN